MVRLEQLLKVDRLPKEPAFKIFETSGEAGVQYHVVETKSHRVMKEFDDCSLHLAKRYCEDLCIRDLNERYE